MRIAIALILLAACGDDGGPALTDATSLVCPVPGALPFRMESNSFARSENKALVKADPRSKDEASDTLGNPNGPIASIYLADAAAATTMPVGYHGVRARTTSTGGLFSNVIPGEPVSLWTYDGTAWQSIGRATTDDNGVYDLPNAGFVAPNGTPVYSMLEGDGSCAEHYTYLFPPGTKVVVSDIDGTLTLDDTQLLKQIADDTYTPVMMGAADKLAQAWAAKGYTMIYLTARPHVVRNETRVWLRDLKFPTGPVITAASQQGADVYKTAWLKRMINTFGWNVVAAYGNADTDITAYENAGIPKAQTFIVGDLAGSMGTTPIPNMDFSAHIASYVMAQPNNN